MRSVHTRPMIGAASGQNSDVPATKSFRLPQISLYRVIVGVLVVAAITAFVFGLQGIDDSVPVATRQGLESVSPPAGVTVVRQTPITADLLEGQLVNGQSVPGYVGELFIDGIRIPEDQLQTIEGQRKYTFVPGDGKEFTEFAAGRLCAAVNYWREDLGPTTSQRYEWCFTIS